MAAPFATAQAEAAALCGAGEGRVAQIVPLAQAVAPLPKLRREDYADGSTAERNRGLSVAAADARLRIGLGPGAGRRASRQALTGRPGLGHGASAVPVRQACNARHACCNTESFHALYSHVWLASHSSLGGSQSVRQNCGKGNVDRRGAARSSIQRKACCNNESIHALSSHEWVGTKRSQARECKRTAYTTRMRRHAWCVMTTNANPRLRRHVLANCSMLCSSWQTAARCKPHLDISFAHCRGI